MEELATETRGRNTSCTYTDTNRETTKEEPRTIFPSLQMTEQKTKSITFERQGLTKIQIQHRSQNGKV